jgi:phosphoribosylformylglycinamidine synthase
VIPVFPGTNCEYDTAEAVDSCGGKSEIIVLKTLSSAAISESLGRLAEALAESQILILPGGFSAGDEPDGSGKFMAALLRQPRLADAIAELLGRDGLVLGICNGFQALVRLGLVPYGEIRDRAPGDPVLARNRIGHHVSRMSWVRVASNASPWLAATEPGDLYGLPVSHGEGRFLIDPKRAQGLLDAGQVATQYVTPDGRIAEEEPWNPNGSVLAIEGITSPDGRILGRMGHSERVAPGLFRNHPDPGDARIIESGVRAFR